MKIKTMDIFVFPLDDLHCGYGLQQGSIMPSLPFIPGRVIRGGLAGWAIRTGRLKGGSDPVFQSLFLSNPGDTAVSFPCCTPGKAITAPLSLFELKGSVENPRTRMIRQPLPVFTDSEGEIEKNIQGNRLMGPVDFLKRTAWPSDIDAGLKPAKRTIAHDTYEVHPPFSLKIDLKAAHDEDKKRVKEENGLYAEEAMPAAFNGTSYYRGTFVYEITEENEAVFGGLEDPTFDPDMVDQETLEAAGPENLIFIGRRKTAAVCYGGESTVIDTENDQLPPSFKRTENDHQLTVSFTSDCIIPQEEHRQARGEMIADLLQASGLKAQRVFTRTNIVHGYDLSTGPLTPMTALSEGSCCFFKGKMTSDELRNLWVCSLFGVGSHQKDGYGRFIVNWNIHDVQGGGGSGA